MIWIEFLHFYQPPTQKKEMVDRIVRESYGRIADLLKTYPRMALTINFSGSVLELLLAHGYAPLLAEYKQFAGQGRIELVGSAMYHPILALLPKKEIKRQIMLHNRINRKVFGTSYRPKGFFIPEMAYSKKVADVVREMGFEWLILDEFHFPAGLPETAVKYTIADNGLVAVFRDRVFSKTFPPEFIFENKDKVRGKYLITAHDAELYGHWHTDDRGYYEKIFTDADIHLMTVSEYLKKLTDEETITPRKGSWESLMEELEQNRPFVLWNSMENRIHTRMWEFTRFTLETIENHSADSHYQLARTYADRGLASCAWWWATGAKLVSTAPISWNPTEIEKGAQELLTAVRSLDTLDLETRLRAEEHFGDLRKMIWEEHWKNYHQK